MQILAFGDSEVEGFFDSEGGWVERLKKLMSIKMMKNDKFWCEVRNLGVSGNTSKDLARRFTSETKARLIETSRKSIILFEIGMNDAAYFRKIGNPKVPEKEFEININKLIKEAKRFTNKIVFIAGHPIDEKKVYLSPFIGAFENKYFYSNDRIARYNTLVEKTCQRQDVFFLDVSKKLREGNYKRFLFDGLHLNSKGHEFLFRAIRDFIYDKKWLLNS